MFKQDPRNYQILFLSLFLILGIGTRDWTLRPDLILVVMLTCLLTQWLAVSLYPNPKEKILNLLYPENDQSGLVRFAQVTSLKSAMITALSLSLLLRADHYITMILAGSLAILSKFVFQVERKHFFNPANFGIIAALILTNDAWVSPGQWGEEGWYALLFAGTGGLVLKRVGRWDTTVAFLGVYTLLEALRNFWLGWTWDVFCHRLMSGSLLLFALFMVTDPRSIPNARISRVIWAGCIALLTFILRNQFFLSTAVFWALFALAPLTVLLDWFWSSSRFSWTDNSSINEMGLVSQPQNKVELEAISIH
jgi:Na+-transporting NADH:ubiquinone oxidoreductase subunit NqrB